MTFSQSLNIRSLAGIKELLLRRRGILLAAHLFSNPRSEKLVVICPGFAKSGQESAYQWLACSLSGGCEVLVVSFRGHGHSGGRFSFGLLEAEDLCAVIESTIAPRHCEVLILGFSLGGTIALSAARLTWSAFGRTTRVMAVSAPLILGSFKLALGALPGLPRLIMSKPLFSMPKVSFPSMRHLRRLFYSSSLVLSDIEIECTLLFCRKDWLIDWKASQAHAQSLGSRNNHLILIDSIGPIHADDLIYLHGPSFIALTKHWIDHYTEENVQ